MYSAGINRQFSAPGEAGRPKKKSVVVTLPLHWSNAAFSSVALRFYSDRNCCNIASRCRRKPS
uniref:Uncharacterized protein n=1 Tax=Kalanchoe fedtschenkoi TaxID=63787 RepID=A0A7N0TN12_KALFE